MDRRAWAGAAVLAALGGTAIGTMLAAAAPPATPALAQPAERTVPPPDDRPFAPPPEEECRRLGFDLSRSERESRAYGLPAASGPARAWSPPRSGPREAQAAPVNDSATEEIVVTGSRVHRREAAPAPPPPSPPPPPPAPAPMAAMPLYVAPPALPGPPPGTINRDRYPDASPNPIRQVAEAPVSTFSIDVDTAAYANVRRHLREGTRPPRDAVRVEELVNYFDYGYPRPESRAEPFTLYTALTPSPWMQGRQLLHVGFQGYAPTEERLPPLNLVFLVDVSGSMAGEDRLPLAKRALDVLVGQLRPQDRVALAVYAGSAGQVLAPTAGTEKPTLRCAIGALEAGGSTAGGQGLALAYTLAERHFQRDAVNRVILMTDGDFNVGIADSEKLEDFVAEKRRSGVYLSVYGFGAGNYNDRLMQTLAQSGNGTAAYVDSPREARKLFRDDFTEGLFPIADDVKIQVEFNPARVSEYRLIGYETRMLAREDFNNDRVDAGEVGAGASVTALYEITPAGGARSVDPLRYGREAGAPVGGAELAFLKLRYKRPGEATSHLLQRAVTGGETPLERAPDGVRWAAAVAGYGQLLRGDPHLEAGYGWAEVARLAESARGDDHDGLKAEFLQLARAAEGAGSINE